MATRRQANSFYSRDSGRCRSTPTTTRYRSPRTPLQPLTINHGSSDGYLPGMGLTELTRDGSLSPSLDCDQSPHLTSTPVPSRGRVNLEHEFTQNLRPIITSNENSIMMMLQNQQVILQQVLEGQKDLKDQQLHLQERLDVLEEKANEPQTPSSSNYSSSSSRKRIVTRELTVCQSVNYDH